MQYKLVSALLALGLTSSQAYAAYVPSEPWSTLTPSGTAPSGAVTDYTASFAIAISPVTSASASLDKRDVVTQIGDGQIQATTATLQVVTQIGDGQIQATTATKKTAEVVSQIGDGQIQATTATLQVVTQIGDGQIQATTATANAVTQIGDGQIQATTATAAGASQITDGQVQATDSASSGSDSVDQVACNAEGTLSMTLKNSILTDSAGRIGSIVANHQFQFDPVPQAGAIYAVGWSITEEGNLALGDNDLFYQCLSGTFYNLYDESIGAQCVPVKFNVVELIDC